MESIPLTFARQKSEAFQKEARHPGIGNIRIDSCLSLSENRPASNGDWTPVSYDFKLGPVPGAASFESGKCLSRKRDVTYGFTIKLKDSSP